MMDNPWVGPAPEAQRRLKEIEDERKRREGTPLHSRGGAAAEIYRRNTSGAARRHLKGE